MPSNTCPASTGIALVSSRVARTLAANSPRACVTSPAAQEACTSAVESPDSMASRLASVAAWVAVDRSPTPIDAAPQRMSARASLPCSPAGWIPSRVCNAAHRDSYLHVIDRAGFTVVDPVRANPYSFLSERARSASVEYGVRSLSLLAHRS